MSTIQACWFHQSGTEAVESTLHKMLEASGYWQPDNQHRWCSDQHSIGLAKAQLYNTACSQKDGVHHEPALSLTITANARLDNRSKLLEQLSLLESDPTTMQEKTCELSVDN